MLGMPCPSWAKTMGERARQCFCTFPLFSTFYPFLILARKERNHKFKLGTAIHMAFPCTNSNNSARHPQQHFLWLLLFCSSLYFLVASAMQPKEASVVITPNEPKLEAALGLAIAAEQQQQKQSGEGRKCEIKVQIVSVHMNLRNPWG